MKAIRESEWFGQPPTVKVSPAPDERPGPVMRVVFAGTPEPALPALDAIAASDHELVGVVTRPDAPAGRGRRLVASPVAQRAEELGVPVLKPEHPRDPEFQDALRRSRPDCCPVVAYGALLPQSALDIPAHGWVNLHFSLLPAWRGAAPVQHALWAGDEVTGATTFRIVRELDAGPTFGVMTERSGPTDTSGDLLARLAEGGARCWWPPSTGSPRATLEAREQPAEGVTLRPEDPASRTPRSTGPSPRPRWTGGSGRARPAPAPGPRSRASGSSWVRSRSPTRDGRDRRAAGPGSPRRSPRTLCFVGTGTTPVRLGEVKAVRQEADGGGRLGPRGPGCAPAPGSAPMADPRSRRSRPRRGAGGAPPARRPPSTRPGSRRTTCWCAVREQDAYTNLLLPVLLRSRGIRDRDAAFATELVAGTIRGQGTYDAVIAACVDRPLARRSTRRYSTRSGWGRTRSSAMRVPSHAAVGTTVDLVRAKVGHGPAGFVNAVLRTGGRARPGRLGAPGRAGPDVRPGRVRRRWRSPTRAGWWRRSAEALGAASAEIDDLLAADNAPPRVTLVARPGLSTVGGAGRGGGSGLDHVAVRRHAAGRRPRATCRRWRPAVPASRTRARSWSPRPSPPRRWRAGTSAGWTSAPGRAARRPCSRPWPDSGRRGCWRLELQPHRAALVRGAARAVRRGLWGVVAADGTRPAWRLGCVRPGDRGRAVHRTRRAAEATGGAVASAALRRRRPGAAAAPAAGRRPRRGPPGRGGGLRDVLPGARRDLGRGVRGAGRAGRRTPRGRDAAVRGGSRPPAGGDGPPRDRSAVAAPARARTRCSWRCCAALPPLSTSRASAGSSPRSGRPARPGGSGGSCRAGGRADRRGRRP